MPKIAYICPHCGVSGESDAGFVGLHVRCTSCSGRVRLAPVSDSERDLPSPEGGMVPLDDSTYSVESATDQATSFCPKCRVRWSDDAVLCLDCGYDRRLGIRRSTIGQGLLPIGLSDEELRRRARRTSDLGLILMAGCGMIGVAIAMLTIVSLSGLDQLKAVVGQEAVQADPLFHYVRLTLRIWFVPAGLFLGGAWLGSKIRRQEALSAEAAATVGGLLMILGFWLVSDAHDTPVYVPGLMAQVPGALVGMVLLWVVSLLFLPSSMALAWPTDQDAASKFAPRFGTRRQGWYLSLAAILLGFSAVSCVAVIAAAFGTAGLGMEGPRALVLGDRLGLLAGGVIAAALARRGKLIHAAAVGLVMSAFLSILSWGPAAWVGASIIIPLTLLGGGLEVILTRVSRYLAPREEWTYRTESGREIQAIPPWRDHWLSLFWAVMALIFLGGCWVPVAIVWPVEPGSPKFFNAVLIGVSSFALGLVCVVLSRRRSAPSARERMERDRRAPVLFLRSFRDDGRSMEEGFLAELLNAAQSVIGRTIEQNLARVLHRVGPVVAIGRPGEELPELGAARMYVQDEDWRDLVLDLLGKAQLVFLQFGASEGLQWEMEQVAARMPPERVILFFTFDRKRDRRLRRREVAYSSARSSISEALSAGLPESIGESCFFTISSEQEGSENPRRVVKALPRRGLVPEGHPYSSLLRRFSRGSAFRRPGKVGVIEVLMVLFIVLAASFVVTALLLYVRGK